MRKGEKRPDLCRARVGTCAVCCGSFRAVKDSYRRKQKYCSKECWAKRNPPVDMKCLSCGAAHKAYSGRKIYCDQKCRDAHYRVRFKAEKSHLWLGGKTSENKRLRTSSAFREWRQAVFTRDGHACVLCGEKSRKGFRVEIHADHIKPLSKYPEHALNVNNGRTLCAPCHKNTDTWGWRSRWGQKAELLTEAN